MIRTMNSRRWTTTVASAAVALTGLVACGDSDGNLTVTTYGEDFIEVEIPNAVGPDGEGFVDNTVVTYSKFLVSFSNLTIRNRDGDVGGEVAQVGVFDLTQAGPHPMVELSMTADTWSNVGVTIAPNASAIAGNVDSAEVADLVGRGASVRAVGTAVHEGTSYDFDWTFSTATAYDECVDGDGFSGVVVPDGGQVSMEITVHGDHLFFDDLQAEGSDLRFAAMASADNNNDGVITLEELATVDLTDLPTNLYGTGNDSSIQNLRQFVEAQTQSLIHFNGEGDCRQNRL